MKTTAGFPLPTFGKPLSVPWPDRRSVGMFAAVLLLICTVTSRARGGVGAYNDLPVTPEETPTSKIEVSIGKGQVGVSARIYLRQTTDADLDVDAFTGYLSDEKGDLTTATVGIVLASDNAATGGPLRLPARPKVRVATLNLANLTDAGSYHGELQATVKGELLHVADLGVHRLGLVIEGEAGDEIALPSGHEEFSHTFSFRSTADVPVKWSFDFSLFNGPDGRPVTPEPSHTEHTFAPHETFRVALKFKTPLEKDYTGTLAFESDKNERETRKIKVTRSALAATVEVNGPDVVNAETGGGQFLWIVLQEKAKLDAEIRQFQFMPFVQASQQEKSFVARSGDAKLLSADGKPLTTPFTLGPNELRPVQIVLPKLEEAGEHTVMLAFTPTDGQTAQKTFRLVVRNPCWVAAAFIAVGVIVSWIIRDYVQRLRPVLVQRQKDVKLQIDLDNLRRGLETPTSADLSVLQSLQGRLIRLDDELAVGVVSDADARLLEVDHKLTIFSEWSETRRRIEHLPDKLRDQFAGDIAGITKYLMTDSAKDDDYAAELSALHALSGKIDAALWADLKTRRDALAQDAETHRNHLANSELEQELSQLIADAGKVLDGDLLSALAAFERLRGNYAALLATNLQATVSPTAPPMLGFDQTSWHRLADDLAPLIAATLAKKRSDVDAATEAYNTAFRIYLGRIADKLNEELARCDQRIASSSATPEEKQKETDAVNAIRTGTAKMAEGLAAGKLCEASDQYNDCLKSFQALPPAVRADAVAMQDDSDSLGTDATPGLVGAVGGGALAVQGVDPASSARPTRRSALEQSGGRLKIERSFLDGLLQFALLIIAVLLGLKALWVDVPTWGGITSQIMAVLWGLGVHTASNGVFDGIASLGQQFKAPAATGG